MRREEKKRRREEGDGDISDYSPLSIQVKTYFTLLAVHLNLTLSPILSLSLPLILSADSEW